MVVFALPCSAAEYETKIRPLFREYCLSCHSTQKQKGDRDLSGVESLDPAKEFPVDSASGEGFMNVGNSLVMSPSLVTKYFDAAKDVASHAVLLPDGIRFSPKNTRRDWTEELLAEIRETY